MTASQTLEGTVVQCLTMTTILMSKVLTLAGTNKYFFKYHLLQKIFPLSPDPPPSPFQQPRYSVSQYHLTNFRVVIRWESPASDGGVGIDSYTLTGAGITTLNGPLMALATLSYNEMHMVSITTSNCAAGESTAAVVTIHEGMSNH